LPSSPPPPAKPAEVVRALSAAGYPAPAVADALAKAYPTLDADALAACLMQVGGLPATPKEKELRQYLLAVDRFTIAQVYAAIQLFFTPRPVPPPPGPSQDLVASQQGGVRGVELWALGEDGQLWTLYQLSVGGPWSSWEGPGFKDQPAPMRHMAAAQQNNGNVMLFTLDDNGAVWAIGQDSPGGEWGRWSGPNLAGQPHSFIKIVASEQKGSRGVELWALDEDGQLWTLYQLSVGGPWSSWEGPGFKNQPAPMRHMAAAQQNNGNVMLFTFDYSGAVWAIGQDSPGGEWSRWQQLAHF